MAGSGGASPRQEVQKYEVRINNTAYDILVNEGLIPSVGATLFDIQQAIVAKEEQGEVTKSSATVLAPMGERAGTERIVNGEVRSTGSEVGNSVVGFGQWIGSFSGSVDVFATGSTSIASVFHLTHFSGAFSSSGLDFENGGTPAYGRVYVGNPSDIVHSSSLGTDPRGQGLKSMPFTGSFIAANIGGSTLSGFKTAESGSASGSARIINNATSSNTNIPGGTYNAKWISGSFQGGSGTYYTSSNVTTQDINNISQSQFIGSVCVASGGIIGNFATTRPGGNGLINGYGQSHPANLGSKLNMTLETSFVMKGEMVGFFRNSGSLTDDNNTGALVLGLTGGQLFALGESGSEGAPGFRLISGSIESLAGEGYIQRGPSQPYTNGSANASYFSQPRTVKITGAIDKVDKRNKKAEATSKFSPRGG